MAAREDDEDIWASTTSPSPSPSPTQPAASTCSFLSTQLSLNPHLHLLTSGAAGGAPPISSPGGGIYAAHGILHHADGGGGYPNAGAASSAPSISPYNFDPCAACRALEDEMPLGPAAAARSGGSAAERSKKRMIKNRESASRSRSRKQAYVHELQREVKLLQEQNDSLREKYEQLKVSVEVPVPMKRTLQRTPSAPF